MPCRTLIPRQERLLIYIRDGFLLPLGLLHLTALPGRRGKVLEPAQHATTATANGDEADLPLLQGVQLGVGGEPAIEEQPRRVATLLRLPVVSEANGHLVRLVAQHVGRGVAHHPPLEFLRNKSHDSDTCPVAFRQPVLFQVGIVAAKRDGVKVQVEGVRPFPQRGLAHQGVDETLAHAPVGSVGIVGGEGRLGQHVEAAEQPGAFFVTQIVDVADTPLAEQLRGQQCQDGLQGGDDARTGPASLPNRGGQVQGKQQRDEHEEASDLGMEIPTRCKRTQTRISYGRQIGAVIGVTGDRGLPGRDRGIGQLLLGKNARQVGLTDRVALFLETLLDLHQGQPFAAQSTDVVAKRIAFRRGSEYSISRTRSLRQLQRG